MTDSINFEDISSSSDTVDISSYSSRRKRKKKYKYENIFSPLVTVLLTVVLYLGMGIVFGLCGWVLGFIDEIRYLLMLYTVGYMLTTIGLYIFWRWRKANVQRIIIIVISVILCICTAFCAVTPLWNIVDDAISSKIYNYANTFTKNIDELTDGRGKIDNKIINIALFGIDTRSSTSFLGNTDNIMILTLDTKNNQIKITSILRDSFVEYTVNGKTYYGKINGMYNKGSSLSGEKDANKKAAKGAEVAVKNLNKIFDLDITEYAVVNFFGMAEMIDAVGGIDVELTEAEVKSTGSALAGNHGINDMIKDECKSLGISSKPYLVTKWGKQHLNGIQAVAYARIRYIRNIWGNNNDYGRTERQRYVMEQLLKNALSLKKSEYKNLITKMIKYTQTSISVSEAYSYAVSILPYISSASDMGKEQMPHSEYQISSVPSGYGAVVYYDMEFAKNLIHAFIYEDMTFDEYTVVNGISKNSWYTGGTGSSTTKSTTTSVSSASSQSTSSEVTSEIISSDISSTESVESDVSDDTSSEIISSEEPTTSGEGMSSEVISSEGGEEEETSSVDIPTSSTEVPTE